ncbi:MAG: hypothetical protein LBL38_01415, partial [Lactobacillales bacterium]|nr:hypothetical protein [Lactobacillales bacterium]
KDSSDAPPPPAVSPVSAATNPQLEKILNDPAKKDRIEVIVITRLHAIDQGGVFNAEFKTALDACENIRALKTATTMQGRPIDLTHIDDKNSIYQGVLAAQVAVIAWSALDKLYDFNPDIKKLALNLIRPLNDMQNEFPKNKIFFEQINQVFYHSRRLLAVTICPQIIEKYGITDAQITRYQTVKQIIPEGEPNAGGDRNTQVCEFTSQGKFYACLLRKKTVGTHFGAFVDIGEVENQGPDALPILKEETRKRLFLKAYHGYPALENKDSGDTKLDTEELRTSVASDLQAKSAEPLDLCEPFVYKLLESLNLGPKVHFLLNPYINNGFYIVTEDLNNAESEFIELGEIENIELILTYKNNNLKLISDLTEISVFVNIFDLGDIKGDNLGYIGRSGWAGKGNLKKAQLIIIDFLTPPSEGLAESAACSNSFLLGHVFVSDEGVKEYKSLLEKGLAESLKAFDEFLDAKNHLSLKLSPPQTALLPAPNASDLKAKKPISVKPTISVKPKGEIKFFKQKLETKAEIFRSKIITLDQDVNTKLTQSRAAMEKFESRFPGQPFESVIQATETEMLTLLNSPANFHDPRLARPNFAALGLERDTSQLQLRQYCESACQNFNYLKGFLAEGHAAWLVDLHQRIGAALEEANKMPSAPLAPQ